METSDPYAIQAYITHAVSNMGIQYVLLVGGDSYDYFDYLGLGSMSSHTITVWPNRNLMSASAPPIPYMPILTGDQVPDADRSFACAYDRRVGQHYQQNTPVCCGIRSGCTHGSG